MALRYAIMTALLEDEMSGYDLARAFDQSLGFFWHASHQQIYRELKNLSERGWVQSRAEQQASRPDRFLYSLTATGRQALDDWVLQSDRMRIQETKDELYIKLYNLSTSNLDYVIDRLRARRQAMMERLYLYERIRRRHYADPEHLPLRRKGIYLALLSGINQGRMYLAWCDEALALISDDPPETGAPPNTDGSFAA